jgi:hypothetical protein
MLESIKNILAKYIGKEPKITQQYIYDLENTFITRYKIHNHNQFSCPEFENIFACLFDILNAYINEFSNDVPINNLLLWQIKQSIELIKSCSQKTKCTNTTINNCPIPNINLLDDAYYTGASSSPCEDNVYETPYDGNTFPYAYCVRTIAQVMHTFDAIDLYETSKGLTQDKQKELYNSPYAFLFFKSKSGYYLDYLLLNAPNVFILPVLQSVGATAFLNIRASRIQLCGLIFEKIFVDENFQSPGNFFWHDINHSRRIYQNNVWCAKTKSITLDELYTMMKIDTEKILPITKWIHKDDNKWSGVIKILLFEIVHEDAYPLLLDEIVKDIFTKVGECYPYERKIQNVDKPYQPINIRYYEQRGTLMNTLYNKLRHTFFEVDTPVDIILKKELRNINDLALGTLILLNKIFELNPELKRTIDIKQIKTLIATKNYRFMSENVSELKNLTPNDEYNKFGGYKKHTFKNIKSRLFRKSFSNKRK